PQVVGGLWVLGMLLHRLLDQRRSAFYITRFVQRSPDQEGVIGVFERTSREACAERLGLVELSLAQERVELQQQGVDQLVIVFSEAQGYVAHMQRFVDLSQRVNVYLGSVQHGFQVSIVERDGLLVALDRFLELTLQRRNVTE